MNLVWFGHVELGRPWAIQEQIYSGHLALWLRGSCFGDGWHIRWDLKQLKQEAIRESECSKNRRASKMA